MSKKTLILFAVLFGLGAGMFAFAQEPSGPVPSSGPSVDMQGIRGYLLGPGDVLDVRVFGQSDLNSIVEVDAEGNISSLPFLEAPIHAQCRTDKEVQLDITKAYGKYIRNPQVSVRISERKSRQPATISGAVKNPMQVMMLRRVRLHELLTKAGGSTDRASGTVQIMHTEPEMCPQPGEIFQKTAVVSNEGDFGLTIYRLSDLKKGKEESDPFIRPGDIVIVTEAEPVFVTGAVMGARELPLRDQLTLARAIAMAGGPQRMANTNEVHIFRQKDGVVGQEDLKFNLDAIKKGKAPDVLLKAYDIIDVGQSGAFSKKGIVDLLTGTMRSTFSLVTQRGIIY
ncbi:MAG: polysaccharide biosynthesis/export family protein [Acidobacteriota bacterium]